jgi:hypothetical protein
MVFEKGGLLRVVYQWPETPAGPAELLVKADIVGSEELREGSAAADSMIGQFLTRATGPAGSFFLVPWPDREWKVMIAFGIPSPESRSVIAQEFSPVIELAALAAWNAIEVHRLRDELSAANDRLGRRKAVERAKGLLQTRNDWTEQEAYEHLRKVSRQRRKTLAETAQDVLRSSRQPTG